MSGRRYFGTGLTGFIGREIVRQLIEKDDTEIIVCLTRGRNNLIEHPKVRYWTGDITTVKFPRPEDYEFTDLIHGAAEANDVLYQDSKETYYTMVEGTRRILEWGFSIPSILFLSSGGAIRDTVYGRGKRHCESLFKYRDIRHNIARIHSVLGEEMLLNGQLAAGKFIWQAINQGKISLYGGTSVRTYLHVSDCARWLLDILNHGDAWMKYFDIAGNEPITIRQLAELIAAIWQVPLEIIDGPDRNDSYSPDIRPALALGCVQTLTLQQSLERIYANHSK